MPLIRLSMVNPFLFELQRRKIECTALLEEVGFPLELPIDADLFVSAGALYEFTELAAEAAGDPYLGATTGRNVDLESIAPFADAAAESITVGDFLARFVLNAEKHATSAKLSLQIDGRRSSLQTERAMIPAVLPAQIDGLYVGMFVTVFSVAMQDNWNPKRYLAKVCNPDVIPPELGPLTLLKSDGRHASIGFPTEWMFQPFDQRYYARRHEAGVNYQEPPKSLVESIRETLAAHVHDSDLTVDRGAQLCGFEKRQLSRKLKAKGTTLAKIIASLREERAKKELAQSNCRINEIALSSGFKDPAVFSRAFKNWTGQSPQEYRRNHRV